MVRAAFRAAEDTETLIKAQVSKAWLATRAIKEIVETDRTTKLLSPRGSIVSANGSLKRTDHPKTNKVLVRSPMHRRSPAVFGCLPSW
jgi:hypothetical protein